MCCQFDSVALRKLWRAFRALWKRIWKIKGRLHLNVKLVPNKSKSRLILVFYLHSKGNPENKDCERLNKLFLRKLQFDFFF